MRRECLYMIFVIVGTHEQQFNRLLITMDGLVQKSVINEPVILQTGFSDYIPQNCQWKKFLTAQEIESNIKQARIVITHGGPASFIASLQVGKIPIVVPRQKKYGEHINNHQLDFVKFIEKKQNNIIPVYDIRNLENIIINYDSEVKKKDNKRLTNTQNFNQKFSEIVDDIFPK